MVNKEPPSHLWTSLLSPQSTWMCLVPEMWEDSAAEVEVMKDMKKPSGEEWEYKDRRQEIVFIGKR